MFLKAGQLATFVLVLFERTQDTGHRFDRFSLFLFQLRVGERGHRLRNQDLRCFSTHVCVVPQWHWFLFCFQLRTSGVQDRAKRLVRGAAFASICACADATFEALG